MKMRSGSASILFLMLAASGCATKPHTKVEDALKLCGEVAKLQEANTYYLSDVKSLVVAGKTEQKISYPDLTPQLRASAMRSITYCINLQMGSITPETYDKLMTQEVTNAAAAENALTPEQLKEMIDKGYVRVEDLLKQAGVSSPAARQAAKSTTAEMPPASATRPPTPSAEMHALTEITGKISDLETRIKDLPAAVAKAIHYVPGTAPGHPAKPLFKLLFAPRVATLDATALLSLHRFVPAIGPDVQLSVVGSADAVGGELRNMELSRQRAQAVAVWLMVQRGIEPRRIHVAALGAQQGSGAPLQDRSVTIYSY